MEKFNKRSLFIFSVVLVPLLTFVGPQWLSIAGISPCWAVLWLLPWSLKNETLAALSGGLYLGLVLDGISLGGATQVPILMILSFWWSRLGKRGPLIERSFNLGLLAWIGTFLFGLSLSLQMLFFQMEGFNSWFAAWSMRTLFAQALISGFMAPIVCSWLLLLARKRMSW